MNKILLVTLALVFLLVFKKTSAQLEVYSDTTTQLFVYAGFLGTDMYKTVRKKNYFIPNYRLGAFGEKRITENILIKGLFVDGILKKKQTLFMQLYSELKIDSDSLTTITFGQGPMPSTEIAPNPATKNGQFIPRSLSLVPREKPMIMVSIKDYNYELKGAVGYKIKEEDFDLQIGFNTTHTKTAVYSSKSQSGAITEIVCGKYYQSIVFDCKKNETNQLFGTTKLIFKGYEEEVVPYVDWGFKTDNWKATRMEVGVLYYFQPDFEWLHGMYGLAWENESKSIKFYFHFFL